LVKLVDSETTIIHNIKIQLKKIIDFFKVNQGYIIIEDTLQSLRASFHFNPTTGNIEYTHWQHKKDEISPYTFIKTTPLNIYMNRIEYYKGMCAPMKNKSLDKISQHCEYLYYNRQNKEKTYRDILQVCKQRMDESKKKPANQYLQNCTNKIEGSTLEASGGRKKKSRKTGRNKKRRTHKRRKNKSRNLYR
jgi:hypothetical protein